jgi:hypothetical protein
MPLDATCGLSPMATDKTRQVPETELKETSFVWIEPPRDDFLKGSTVDPLVSCSIPISGRKLGIWEYWMVPLLLVCSCMEGGYMMGNGSETFDECGMQLCILLTVVCFHHVCNRYRS